MPYTMLGWHFLASDKRLRYNDNRLVQVGETYSARGGFFSGYETPTLCEFGLHACDSIIDALNYAPGPILCRVELSGNIVIGKNKAVAWDRRVLSMFDATSVLFEFGCLCAEDALKIISYPDPRSIDCVEAVRGWLRGEVKYDELDAARTAAKVAIMDANNSITYANAARSVARAAAACASDFATCAASTTADEAANVAVWLIEEYVDREAARKDIRARQNNQLLDLVMRECA